MIYSKNKLHRAMMIAVIRVNFMKVFMELNINYIKYNLILE
jgi:hypothetical protein